MTNADFGNYRGFDVRLDRRIGNLFNGTWRTPTRTPRTPAPTRSPTSTRLADPERRWPAATTRRRRPTCRPTDTRPHNLAGSFSLKFPNDWKPGTAWAQCCGNVGIFATFRLASGTAYTRCPVRHRTTKRALGPGLHPAFQGD